MTRLKRCCCWFLIGVIVTVVAAVAIAASASIGPCDNRPVLHLDARGAAWIVMFSERVGVERVAALVLTAPYRATEEAREQTSSSAPSAVERTRAEALIGKTVGSQSTPAASLLVVEHRTGFPMRCFVGSYRLTATDGRLQVDADGAIVWGMGTREPGLLLDPNVRVFGWRVMPMPFLFNSAFYAFVLPFTIAAARFGLAPRRAWRRSLVSVLGRLALLSIPCAAAVAILIAAFAPFDPSAQPHSSIALAGQPDAEGGRSAVHGFREFARTGLEAVAVRHVEPGRSRPGPQLVPTPAVESVAMRLARAALVPGRALQHNEQLSVIVYGWPWPCMAAIVRDRYDPLGGRGETRIVAGVRVGALGYAATACDARHVIPTRPLLGGLALNALVYVAIGLCISAVAYFGRWRALRWSAHGRCAACGYRLDGLDCTLCPECGHGL